MSYDIFRKLLLWWVRGRLGHPMQRFRLSKPRKTKQNPVLDRHEMQVNVASCKRLSTDFAKCDSTLQICRTKGNETLIVMPRWTTVYIKVIKKRTYASSTYSPANLLSAKCTNKTQLNTGQTIQMLPQTQNKIHIQSNSHLHFDICSVKLFLVAWILTWKERQ